MIGMEIETASGKIRNTHVADEEEDYGRADLGRRFPVRQVVGESRSLPAQPPGLTRPAGLAGFTPAGRSTR